MKVNTEILTDYLNKLCDEKTNLQVEEWLNSNLRNRRYFEELQFYWECENSSKQITIDVEKGYKQLTEKRKSRKKYFKINFIRYAAAVAILIATSLVSYIIVEPFSNQILVENFGTQDKQLELPDGTMIVLAQGGTLEYSKTFGDKERLVHLSGEAFFDVAKDKSKPFIITTSFTKTRVVGTSFRIKEGDLKTSIDVKTGIVEFMELNEPANKVRLVKGETAKFIEKQKVMLKESLENNKSLLKISHLEYQHEKLASICNDLNEVFNKNIRLESKSLGQLSLTAKFEDQNLESMLETIAYTLDLEIEKYKDYILLK
jgi:ferric-dicitrate binding protein FerR (iron transport regulator)